ncbi:TPA: hypothetical protein IAA92_04855 [Candidatus Galligastranaerophilus intestinigallinarum]|nr:hypothetical protein [Candidatus Galligastranaerophilus intestinigallinarum]
MTEEKKYKRWYDYDPLLLQVVDLLREYPDELKNQAEIFLKKVEERVSKDAIDRFYSIVKPMIKGNRWYDHDPTLSLTIELLRVVPRDIQRQAANNFIQILQTHGVNVEKAE